MAPLNVLPYPRFKRALNFGPLSGSEPKLKRPAERYILTAFAINIAPNHCSLFCAIQAAIVYPRGIRYKRD